MPVTSALLLYIPFTVGQSHVLVLLDSGFEYGAPLRTSALAKRYPNPVNHTLDSKGVVLVWYVIQVINGREHVMRERIERVCQWAPCKSSFIPNTKPRSRYTANGSARPSRFFPGYLICDTADPRTVQQYLLRMDDFARVLSQDGQFVPLAKEETQLLSSFTHRGDHVVPMSDALKDGDQVVVTAGPLLGHEGLIKDINRRKCTAYLEVNLCGRRVTTRVGLAVLSNERRAAQNHKDALA